MQGVIERKRRPTSKNTQQQNQSPKEPVETKTRTHYALRSRFVVIPFRRFVAARSVHSSAEALHSWCCL